MIYLDFLRNPYLEHLNRITNDVPGEDFKEWVRSEDPLENYKDSIK